MAKAKLTAAVSKWVERKGVREEAQTDNGKVRHTMYVSRKASQLLWQRRVDTGVPVSRTVEDLVIKHLGV
ncbi:MAG: hypothetical protein AAB268_05930 [Elusimicrobiota bacterium]